MRCSQVPRISCSSDQNCPITFLCILAKWLFDAQVTLNCLHEMFTSAKDIMQWLSSCARIVAKADRAVEWVTPLGLPVVQPYRKRVGSSPFCFFFACYVGLISRKTACIFQQSG